MHAVFTIGPKETIITNASKIILRIKMTYVYGPMKSLAGYALWLLPKLKLFLQ